MRFLALAIASLALAGQASAGGLLEFLQSRRERWYDGAPMKVLAFYYTWYGRPGPDGKARHWGEVKADQHWIAESTHYPAKGAYDSHDPAILDYHIELAKGCGIDAFIATWWAQGDFHDEAFALLLDHAKKKGFEATVYWETVPGQGQAKLDRAVNDLAYILQKYGGHPAFLKLDGKPVLFVYGRVMDQVKLGEWPETITKARKRTGKDFLLIADGYREDYARLFDGVHTYNPCEWVAGKKPDELAEVSRKEFAKDVTLARTHGKVSCLTVIPGYDDTKVRTPGLDAQRQGGETYRVLWEQAFAASPDWVLITSWNEWHEGSEIEPSWEDGDKYVEMTRRGAEAFKRRSYIRRTTPDGPPEVPPAWAKPLRGLYQGKTIGVLPDFGGKAVFWLADAGLALKELSWGDLLDPAAFNAKSLPVVVYAGDEDYVQSVKEPEDVDRALQRYLREGGVLMVLPTGPFPFFYNEKKEAVASSPKFGLFIGEGWPLDPLAKSWEKPPAGVKLAFQLDTQRLAGLPATVPFPEGGDLRWRPATFGGLTERDAYLPLAKLTDERGSNLGDGIALIELKPPPQRNGTIIYAWMRMGDVLDPNALYLSLFRLAAEKAARNP